MSLSDTLVKYLHTYAYGLPTGLSKLMVNIERNFVIYEHYKNF